jgi:NAD(P)-dependent dehydrogenase (short-subunit alcohol dehydrogenase family)
VAVVDLDLTASQRVADELGGVGLGLAADVGVEAQVVEAVGAAERQLGPIDLLVCNAGIGTLQGLEAPTEAWQQIWDVNVMAHVFAARAVLPGMVARGQGYVLTTASAAGLLSQIGDAPYSVTKHAAVGLAEWLSITYGDQGIGVSCLCPQGVNTDMLREAAAGEAGAVVVAQGTLEPEDVAEAVVRGLADERFLILPHPEVREYQQRKAGDPDRWLAGMRKLQRRVRDGLR